MFVESKAVMLLIDSDNGAIIQASEGACQFYGYTSSELTTMSISDINVLNEAEINKELKYANKNYFRYQHKLASGEIREVEVYTNPILVEDKTLLFSIIHDITEQNKIERDLHTQARILNQIHESVVSTDLNGNIISWNKGAERQFGYSKEEVIGKPISIVYPPESHEFLKSNVIAPLQSKGNHEVEVTARRKSGEDFFAYLSLSMLYDEQGNPSGMFGYTIDISERKLTEETLQKNEAFLRTLIEILPDLVWVKDPEGVYLTCNHRFESFFGAKESEIVGKTDFDFVDKALANFSREKDKIAMANGGLNINEETVTFADDGHTEQLETIKTPMLDANGKIIGILGIARNITEHKELEAALQEGFDIYQAAINTSILGFWVIDLKGQFLETNDGYLRQSGYSREEFLKMSIPDLEASMTPEQVQDKIKQVMETGLGRFRTRHRRKDGSTWPVGVVTSFSEIRGGRFFVFLEDLTEQDKIDENLSHYRNHLEELVEVRTADLENASIEAEKANNAKSEFLSSMSHELRTPLNAIIGFSQLMEFTDDLSDENKENVKEILDAGYHLLKLVNEVLDLAKIESGTISLSIEPTELSLVVEECLALLKTLAEKRNIGITTSGLSGAIVQADRTRLKQALLNLISNAIKYNNENGSVHISAQIIDGQQWQIIIADTGQGIAPQSLNELFQPFKRLAAESSAIEGTGIGLTLTQKIIEMMGGRINVESKLGVGSTFSIYMPVGSLAEPPGNSIESENFSESKKLLESIPDKKHTILYIEDNPANLRLVTQILKLRKDTELISAYTPSLGLELALEHKPDLILLDINLPGMDGYQVLELIKGMDKLKNTKVVALTANAMMQDIERGRAAGFLEYLTKPLNIVEFNKVLDRLLSSRN